MSLPYCSVCGYASCRCTTVTEVAATECVDPGLTNDAAYAGVYTEDLCPKRLIPFRGLDIDGNQVTDTEAPLQAGIMVQKVDGQVQWSNDSLHESPESEISVVNEIEAADVGNYIPYVVGKTVDFRERRLVGDPDVGSGQWKMVWIASMQQWTTVPDFAPDLPELCTTLVEGFILDPENTEGYLIQVESTEHLIVGVSVVIGGFEMIVTDVVDSEFVRVRQFVAPAEATVITGGDFICNIGFRPCPQTEEAEADTIPGCLDNVVVSLTTPADISGMKVPGFLWRNQLGKWAFLPAPVDGVTGIVEPNMYLATPDTPADNVANLPSFRAFPTYQEVSPHTTIYTQSTGTIPVDDTDNITLSGTGGYLAGATIAWISIYVSAMTTVAAYQVTIKINNVIRAYTHIGPDSKAGSMYNGPFPVTIPVSTIIEVEVDIVTIVGGATTSFTTEVYVDGYTAPVP